MNNIDQTIKKLLEEKKILDYKIKALQLAKTLLGHDGKGNTIQFVKSRGKPTTVAQVAKHFKITTGAANQRLLVAHKKGALERVKKGYYR